MASILGKIHSTETFGTLDGPGIRYVLFLQGCPMRCLYCHNPDTWALEGGRYMSAQEILREYNKNRDFYTRGGITATGGEPLMQIDFLIELFRAAKAQNIHTCIDTSGITYSQYNETKLDELMQYTDLVMLDIKHIDSARHRELTGYKNEKILAFAQYLDKKDVPIWIRHVVVEGYTDSADSLYALGEFIGELKNLRALDVLPYHTMGVEKYEELGIKYPLPDVAPLTKERALLAKAHILRGIRDVRKKQET